MHWIRIRKGSEKKIQESLTLNRKNIEKYMKYEIIFLMESR